MSINTSEVQSIDLITSMRGIYDEDHADGVMNTLLALTSRLRSTEKRKWAFVLRELGKIHSDFNRFNILLGLYLALPFVEAGEWLSVWLKALPAAGIHPISVLLCSWSDEDTYKQQIEDLLQAMNDEHRWFEGWKENKVRKYESDGHWELKLLAGRAVSNVLGPRSIKIFDASGHDKPLVGDGWCVHALGCETNGHWYGCRIGRNLTVVGGLILGRCVGPISIGGHARVGGLCMPQRNLQTYNEIPMALDLPQRLGVRIRGKDFNTFVMDGHPTYGQLRSPIEIPDSYVRLVHHIPECAWMQPQLE